MFRFTIRDVLWLTVVVGLGCGWFGEYRQRMLDSSELRPDYRRLREERDWLLLSRSPDMHAAWKRIAKDNISLREQVETYKKLVEAFKADREEMKGTTDANKQF